MSEELTFATARAMPPNFARGGPAFPVDIQTVVREDGALYQTLLDTHGRAWSRGRAAGHPADPKPPPWTPWGELTMPWDQ
jgi:hypothetical protein